MCCNNRFGTFLCAWFSVVALLGWAPPAAAEDHATFMTRLPACELHGFVEARAGVRTQSDSCEQDASVLETRLQAEITTQTAALELKLKGDVWADGITEAWEQDTREAWVFLRPAETLDIKLGRQILTWGTGELVFLNDLFPKDWQSFFIGRDAEYLKAPSDAAKLSWFSSLANLDLVYTPQFDPDRFVTGEYLSYWDADLARPAGQDRLIHAAEPDKAFRDDETALRLYRNLANYELALYGYRGFRKRPAGQAASGQALFPRLNVYGASVRGPLGPGIANLELACYQSADDRHGTNPAVDNSEMRYLVGYNCEMAKDFNAGLQYYVEQLLDYADYKNGLAGPARRDRFRQVLTLQLNKLLLSQNLELSLSAYYSPSDQDAYLIPKAQYKLNDHARIEAGANIFKGRKDNTFFGQFDRNTNIYSALRYSF